MATKIERLKNAALLEEITVGGEEVGTAIRLGEVVGDVSRKVTKRKFAIEVPITVVVHHETVEAPVTSITNPERAALFAFSEPQAGTERIEKLIVAFPVDSDGVKGTIDFEVRGLTTEDDFRRELCLAMGNRLLAFMKDSPF